MVKQRFLTHFKPWLFAVIKAGGVIVGYQLFDQSRTYFQHPPLTILDVVTAATTALLMVGLLCGLWAWGEWGWYQLHKVRALLKPWKAAYESQWRDVRTAEAPPPLTRRMV